MTTIEGNQMCRLGLIWILLASFLLLRSVEVVAAPCGQWQKITTWAYNTSDPGLARTSDNVLHIAWNRHDAAFDSLLHSAITANCQLKSTADVIAANWNAINESTPLLRLPDGSLRVFFAGIHSSNTFDSLNSHVVIARASAKGNVWNALEPADKTFSSKAYAAAGIGAGLTPGGTPVFAWGDSAPGANRFQFGIGGTKNFNFQGACCVYDPKITTNKVTGDILLGWYSSLANRSGLYVQRIKPTGLIGTATYLPKSANANRTAAVQQKIAMIGHPSGGVYVAYGSGYPNLTRVNLWRYGAANPHISIPVASARNITIAASVGGRLWLLWEDSKGYYAARTNRQANKLGAIVAFQRPAVQLSSLYSFGLRGDGVLGPLDVLALPFPSTGNTAWQYRRVFPGLSLSTSPNTIPLRGGKVTFTVTDAGEPIQNALVTVAGLIKTTNAQGQATLNIPAGPASNLSVRATKTYFTQAISTLKRS